MAKVVNPNNTTHSFTFQPRFSITEDLGLYLFNESTKEESPVLNTYTLEKNNLIIVTFDFEFKERDEYQITIYEELEIAYRGKLFATEQETQNFLITEGYIEY